VFEYHQKVELKNILKINRLQDEQIVQYLIEEKGEDEAKASSVAHLADGDLGTALKLLDSTENNNALLFLEWMRLCYVGNGVQLVNWVAKFSTIGREDQKYFLQYGLHFMREYMVLKLTGNENVRLLPNELKTAQNLTKIIEFDQVEKITNLFNDLSYYVERNANPKILFLDASLKMNQILKNKLVVNS